MASQSFLPGFLMRFKIFGPTLLASLMDRSVIDLQANLKSPVLLEDILAAADGFSAT